MTDKCYKDCDGNYISSDYVLFIENPKDIIDKIYIKDVWYYEPCELYKEILYDWRMIRKYRNGQTE